ncbi:MAG: tRNA pseudouridine(55) synthase TruB [Nitrospinota bacterium]|nr:tRNA pseudouridine(55) synthase TruB [Nitrospinota bacterium]
MDGFLVIDKPGGITSAEVIRVIKRGVRPKKIGYLGTLDPIATGVLVVAMGRATKLILFMEKQDKEYDALLTLGAETNTQDSEGEIVNQADPSQITEEQVKASMAKFVGEIDQVPPMFSAKKQQGQRLYTLARQGITVERPPVRVTIRSIDFIEKNGPVVRLTATVSTGAYLRTICHDIGNDLGVYGHLSGLVRLRSGIFRVQDAIALDSVTSENMDEVRKNLISLADGLGHLPMAKVIPHATEKLKDGIPLGVSDVIEFEGDAESEYVRIVSRDRELIGVGNLDGPPMAGFPFTLIKPKRVMANEK